MGRAARSILLACAVVGCAGKRNATPKADPLAAAKRAWLGEWRKGHTYELAEEFLRLYGGDTVREATEIVHTGTEQALWTGHEARFEMPLAEIEDILGEFDYSTDHEHRYVLKVTPDEKPDEWEHSAYLGVEDIASQGIEFTADMTPVLVWAMRLIPMPLGGYGHVPENQARGKLRWPLPREKLVFRATPTLTDETASGLRVQLKDGSVVPLMVRYLLFDVEGREVKAVWSTTLLPNHTKLDLQKEYEFRLVPGRYGEYNVGHVKDGDAVIFGRDPKNY